MCLILLGYSCLNPWRGCSPLCCCHSAVRAEGNSCVVSHRSSSLATAEMGGFHSSSSAYTLQFPVMYKTQSLILPLLYLPC